MTAFRKMGAVLLRPSFCTKWTNDAAPPSRFQNIRHPLMLVGYVAMLFRCVSLKPVAFKESESVQYVVLS